jgi:acyl-CoA synthetase (AMP-forming)/AMP-acid ligase II
MQRFELRPPPPPLQKRYRDAGHWLEQGFGAFLDEKLRACAGLGVHFWSETDPHHGTLAAVHESALRLAGALAARGIRPGDVVSYQIPNRVEALIVFYGCALAGVVLVPIVHFYGSKEVRFILERSGARMHLTAARFRGTDYLKALDGYRAGLDGLEHVVVIGGARPGELEFEQLLAARPLAELPSVDPAAPAVIAFTSGTTADPKGVIHPSYSLIFETLQLAAVNPMRGRPVLTGAPVSHMMGMLSGALIPLVQGHPIHLIDVWNPQRVLEIMLEADIASGGGSTYFLTSLLDAPGFGPQHIERMRNVGLGGAPVPAAVSDRAEALGIATTRAYGSTEHPSITGSTPDEPAAKRKYTDGRPLEGIELRLVDDEGSEVPVGEPGEILSRGPERFWGYTDPALSEIALDADGWYRTEDVGVLDADGFLTITDRKKDIIIRGGENVSAAEVEELLMRMPGVTEVAVVAAPDARMGEHACAFLRMQPGQRPPDLPAVRAHLEREGLARQKWPEELREVADFARTASGKIKKFALRDELRRESGTR